jgi:soluble lytic murein transglycosylase-like protein
MMMARLGALSLGAVLAVLGGAVSAREVQVVVFAPTDPTEREAAPGARAPDRGLAQGESAQTRMGEPATRTAGFTPIAVPGWLRSALAGRREPADFSSAALPARIGCTLEPYRPHRWLSREMQRRRARYYDLMADAACEAGVPTHLFDALVLEESRYDPAARSPAGAAGLAQLMPGTAAQLGVRDGSNVAENLRAGARYLRSQLDAFGRYDLALGAYNAGPGRIRRYGGLPPFRETRAYVANVLRTARTTLERHSGVIETGASAPAADLGRHVALTRYGQTSPIVPKPR